MNCKIFVVSIIVLVAFLAIGEGLGVDDRCRCINTESRRMGKLIEKIELFPPSSHCKDPEIIATLKETKQEICLDPAAPWVKKIIERIIANKSP
ncbi:interleukin-8 [Misgurnus anguillicaudatus]|uniref:interleukin-8 n=1 Tax=Misgurnus anguillicaudatus TaxID=75329 RepID=UPI002435DFBA|nr:interleukin-8-like [Misgurnus anguillicaudatus]